MHSFDATLARSRSAPWEERPSAGRDVDDCVRGLHGRHAVLHGGRNLLEHHVDRVVVLTFELVFEWSRKCSKGCLKREGGGKERWGGGDEENQFTSHAREIPT